MQDYKYLHYKSNKPKKNWTKRILVLIFLFFIAVLLIAIYFKEFANSYSAKEIVFKTEKPKVVIDSIAAELVKRFTFYDILATGETIIKDDGQLLASTSNNKIYLQLNAFKTAKEADDFQVNFKIIELQPTVESLFLEDKGGQWFAVRLGPFENDDDIVRTKALLRGNGYVFAVVSRKN